MSHFWKSGLAYKTLLPVDLGRKDTYVKRQIWSGKIYYSTTEAHLRSSQTTWILCVTSFFLAYSGFPSVGQVLRVAARVCYRNRERICHAHSRASMISTARNDIWVACMQVRVHLWETRLGADLSPRKPFLTSHTCQGDLLICFWLSSPQFSRELSFIGDTLPSYFQIFYNQTYDANTLLKWKRLGYWWSAVQEEQNGSRIIPE